MIIIDWNKCRHLIVITCCWLGLLTALNVDALKIVQREDDNTNNIQAAPPPGFESHVFNPRVDYNNEWRPVGRGDPLKNDPTFDYSPPALERVRYWADNSGSEKEKKEKKETLLTTQHGGDNNKNDLSHLSDRMRQNPNSIVISKNEKQSGNGIGNQPMRYTSIRRSYYAHQLPTRLMPPPMHSNSVGQLSVKSSTVEPAAPSTYQHYHQNVQYSSTGTPSKPYYSTAVTSPWTAAYSTHTVAAHKMPMPMPYADVRPEESINYLSITRPDYVHSNILSNANDFKQNPSTARKPWVHHLLQKEVIKPPLAKPQTMSSTKYTMHPTKPFFTGSSIYSSKSSMSQPTFQTTTTARTSMPTKMSTTTISTPIYVPTTPRSTTVPSTQTVPFSAIQNKSTASAAFLIPTNAANFTTYPTVAPMKLTTDSLFSHYNQPEKPLIGPMYLIIEGHSKVKTYGKNGNETTTHEPKIVPISPKREPIVHHVVSHDERGINFQVKHLHTKLAAQITTTPTWTTTTTINDKMIKTTTMPTPTTIEEKNATNAGDPPTGMQGLLSLLDSSLGNFFLNDDTKSDNSRERIPPKAIAQPTIFVTTTTGRPRVSANNRRRLDNVVDLLPPSPRESRQIFDYDQLPESRLKELTNEHSPPEDLSLRSSSSVGDVEDDDDANGHELDDHNIKNP